MKKLKIAGLTALTLLGSLATSQAQATTAAVGYVTLASAANPIPANTDAYLSVPMEASVDFTGLATSATGSTLTVTGAAFTVNQFAPATGGYYLRIKNGASAGQTAEITSNTADTLTLALENGDNLTNVDSSTQIEIVKYFTLSTFFETNLTAGAQVYLYGNDDAGLNPTPDNTIVWTGSQWFDTKSSSFVDATLYPGEGFILRNNTATPVTNLVITGNVPTVSHRTKLTSLDNNQQDFYVSYLSPVSEAIGSSNLGFTAGDRLLVFDNSAAGINKTPSRNLTFTGSFWFDPSANPTNVDTTFFLEPGNGYILRRATNSVGTTEWSSTQSFNQ